MKGKKTMEEKRCYTVDEIRKILGISRPATYALLRKREFRWVQLSGGIYRISKSSFDNWLDRDDSECELTS